MDQLPDLHRHLDGSLRPATLAELLGSLRRSELDQDYRFRPGMTLAEALSRFQLTLSVLQTADAVKRVASEICEDAAREGVTTLEIRFAPQLHFKATQEEIVDAALDGIAGRAGLLLCGLYGESPEVIEGLVDIAASRPGVTGIDLAGGPLTNHAFRMEDYAAAFRRAAFLGIGRTVHASEARRPAQEIRTAITELYAQRIGHGTSMLEDPQVVALVLERQVTIEACPTSNMQTGAIDAIDQHPLPRWLELGVRATVCTDNTLFSDVDSPEEHRRAAGIPGMTPALLARSIECGHAARFTR